MDEKAWTERWLDRLLEDDRSSTAGEGRRADLLQKVHSRWDPPTYPKQFFRSVIEVAEA